MVLGSKEPFRQLWFLLKRAGNYLSSVPIVTIKEIIFAFKDEGGIFEELQAVPSKILSPDF